MTSIAPLSRRAFLKAAPTLPFFVTAGSAAAAALAQSQPATAVPIGLELYSVRTELAKDLAGTVTGVAKMGYQVVEFYSPYMSWSVDEAKQVRTLLDDLGVTCHSTHNGADAISPELMPKAIELNQIIGSRSIILASPGKVVGLDGWKRLAERISQAADTLRPLGMRTGFHNHQSEWRPVDGQRPMDILAKGTPKDVTLQLDAGTCVEAGADPVAWINANPGRVHSIHLKDWGAGAGRGYTVAFGEGDVQWKNIFAAAEATGGIEYYLIEQEHSAPGDAMAMAERCLANYKKLRA